MRILKLYDGDYPWDVREEKILRTLTARGHRVTLLARNRAGRPRREDLPEARIRRLPCPPRLESLAGLPVFCNPVWVREALRAARAVRPERVLVRDLPLAPLGQWVARRARCPVIVDMAEPYPEGLRANWLYGELGGLDHLVRNPSLALAIERRVLRRGPRTLVVSPEAGERLERMGLPPGRWTLVGNTPDPAWLEEAARRRAALPAALEKRHVLVFAGILLGDRGVDVAIRAVDHLRREGRHDVGLLVIGEGRERARFEAEARQLGLEGDRVCFLGHRPHRELLALTARCHVGLLPFRACTHMHTTLANKLFDTMALGLPVVATDLRATRRVLEETGAGLVFRDADAADLARRVTSLLDDPAGAQAMGERGRKAVRETYGWPADARRLVEAVERP